MGKKTKRYCQECFANLKKQEENYNKLFKNQNLDYTTYAPMKKVV